MIANTLLCPCIRYVLPVCCEMWLGATLYCVVRGNIVPSLFIHDKYTPEIIHNTLKRQKIVVRKMKTETDMYGETTINPNAYQC